MRITKEDQYVMVVKDRNMLFFLVSIIFIAAGFFSIVRPDIFDREPPVWLGYVVILIGVCVIFFAKITIITLDKHAGKALFRQRSVTSKKSQEYDLASIKQIEMHQAYAQSNHGRGGYSYTLAFLLHNGEEVPLNASGSSVVRVLGKQIVFERRVGERIAKFLNIPFEERRLPTISETLSTIRGAVEDAMQKREEEKRP